MQISVLITHNLSLCLSIYSTIYQSVYLSIQYSIHTPYQSIYPPSYRSSLSISISLSVYPAIFLSVYLPVHRSLYQSIRLSPYTPARNTTTATDERFLRRKEKGWHPVQKHIASQGQRKGGSRKHQKGTSLCDHTLGEKEEERKEGWSAP